MRNLSFLLIFLLSFQSFSVCVDAKKQAKESSTNTFVPTNFKNCIAGEKVTLKIDGMKCGMCVSKIKKIVKKFDPEAKNIKVLLKPKSLNFNCGSNTCNVSQLAKQITDEGFQVSIF